jgi:DNA-binding NarL/FixJ family response regulator
MRSRRGLPALRATRIGRFALPASGRRGSDLLSAEGWLAVGRALALSRRELQIVQLIFDGRKLSAVAQESGLALGTVKTYCQRVYRKVGVNDQRELALAVFAAYLDLLPGAVPPLGMTSAGRQPNA